MKKSVILLMIFSLVAITVYSQKTKPKVELLYFKANLACCKAKACNALEADIIRVVQKCYPDGAIVCKQIKLDDQANKPLIDKYSAKSQTVIIVYKGKKEEKYYDISGIVQQYNTSKNEAEFEKQLKAKVEQLLKSK